MFFNQPNQVSDANAHHLFKLGQIILYKMNQLIRNSELSVDIQSYSPLNMCALQLYLYALGLHNRATPNWLSRNYSPQVNWIATNVSEIGAPAIFFLLGTWEGILTPKEVANIANEMSDIRHNDSNNIKAAAQLAISCLKYSVTLNSNEITRVIVQVISNHMFENYMILINFLYVQCLEISDKMMETACRTIEEAAKYGRVLPEVLFNVAKHWLDLYLKVNSKNVFLV